MITGKELDTKLWKIYKLLQSKDMYRQMAQTQRYASATILSLLYEFLDDKTISDAEFRAYMMYAKQWFIDNEKELKKGV
jgi:hypothetical protein